MKRTFLKGILASAVIVGTGASALAEGFGYAIAFVVGLIFALGQRTPYRPLTFIVRETVEFIRSTPLVLQIFFVFYVGPQFGIRLSR
ncbi:MAG: ABC transporter permease subunit [Rhodobacter sp.]|nr:ABC transporter permease subunit [Rhodobacter sp.]